MKDKIKFNFPEVNIYMAFIFTLCLIISYYDLSKMSYMLLKDIELVMVTTILEL